MRPVSPPAPAAWPSPGKHQRWVELELRALTPIYKGGSTTAQIDEGRPFRAPSIRGALRFWWRATSSIPTTQELREREEQIFGGVHGERPVASAVSVAVLVQESRPGKRPSDKPYAFGVTGREPVGDAKNRQVHNGATGRIRLEWRDDASGREVKRAIEAWLLFGGIGGRSRRGAGSVWWVDGPEVPANVGAYVERWRALVPRRPDQPWPTLCGGALLVGPEFDTADKAWAEGLDGMRDVRASRGVRASFATKRGVDLLEWKRSDYIPIATHRAFRSSRAALGLPIRFQGTTGTFVLDPKGQNRYPSPLHLKVIEVTKRFRPVCLALRGPTPVDLSAGAARGKLDPSGLDRFLDLAGQLPGWSRYP